MPYLRGHEEHMEEANPFRDPPKTEREWLEIIYDKLSSVEKQTILTNGRVSQLETWKSEVLALQREDKAYQSGLGQALITKKHWRAVAAVIGGVGLMAGTAGALVALGVKLWQ